MKLIRPGLLSVIIPVPCLGEWLGPGGLPGLQNRWRVALRAAVGSTPIHSRLTTRHYRFTDLLIY
jgi:hypothetical protein